MNDDGRNRTNDRHRTPAARPCPALAGLALSMALGMSAASADDTEIYFGQGDRHSDTNPNVMFVLDTSGSMSGKDGTGISRLDRMKDALYEIIEGTTDVNVGLMRFNGSKGGSAVIWPVSPIDAVLCEGGGCSAASAAPRIDQGTDDVEERLTLGNAVRTDDHILNLGMDESVGVGVGQAVGLRFESLDVPQGATITSARLEFAAYQDSAGPARLDIGAHASDDAPEFTGSAGEVSSRPLTGTVSWDVEPWTANERYSSVDLSEVIQAVTDRPGWCGGNAVALVIKGIGERAAQSSRTAAEADTLDGIDPERAAAPRLHVGYTTEAIPTTGGCATIEAVFRISASDDDAEEEVAKVKEKDKDKDKKDKKVKLKKPDDDSSDLELTRDGKDEQLIGLRFAAVQLPRDATIESATIDFQVDEKQTGDVSLRVLAEASGNPSSYDEKNKGDISVRDTLAGTVAWDDLPVYEVGERVSTPDLGVLVQELVRRGDWASGNAMAFMIERTAGSGTRTMESYDGDRAGAPKLRVRYTGRVVAADPTAEVTARLRLREAVDEIDHAGGTPIVDALYEAAQYMRGGPVDYGRQRGADGNLKAYNRTSHPDSWSGGTLVRPAGCTEDDLDSSACTEEKITGAAVYESPIASACQSNHIVFLTDGEATSNSSASKVRTLTGKASCEIDKGDEACGEELASWLHSTDHASTIPRTQSVTTHMIGFNFSGSWLKSLAKNGGGGYYEAKQASDLTAVFQTILSDVAATDESFVAPGTTVNQFDRLTHRDDIYFAVFRPETGPNWSGNLKRYAVDDPNGDGEIRVLDVNRKPAVDADTGFFANDAKSYWSDVVDGPEVTLGGAAGRLDTSVLTGGRNTYTFTGDGTALNGYAADLTRDAHALDEDNDAITESMLSLDEFEGSSAERAAYRTKLLKWARGVDVLDADEDGDAKELRGHIGDPMHSRPVLLNYNEEASGGSDGEEGSDTVAHSSVFLSTNEGYLHSIDRDSGDENYAFMPKELLGNLAARMSEESSTAHPYGLDGSMSVWTEDRNGNVSIDTDESAYLYTGMRRGGRNYYALDVSRRLAPKLAWVIKGGSGDFAELGQSWSRPVPSRVMLDGEARDVVIFGAGYDTTQDAFLSDVGARHPIDTQGRGVFVVDAKTGERLWAALGLGAKGADKNYAAMLYGVPGDVRVIDIDFDGFADQLWFGDMGGQIWRFDIASYHQQDDTRPFMDGGVFADLSTATRGEERRFYYEPDVALIGKEGKRSLAISIGSGWRAHPLDDTVEDRFYVLRSPDIFDPPAGLTGAGWAPITEADLVEVSGGSVDPATSEHGWYLDLPHKGEKVLGDSITVNNQVIFTSYRPDTAAEACSAAVGGGAMYVLDILDGSATVDSDGDGDIDDEDRDVELTHGGIPPEPAALITEHGPTVLVGPVQPVDVEFDNLTQRSYWLDQGAHRPAAATPVTEE